MPIRVASIQAKTLPSRIRLGTMSPLSYVPERQINEYRIGRSMCRSEEYTKGRTSRRTSEKHGSNTREIMKPVPTGRAKAT